MSLRNAPIKDINIFFKIITPNNYDEFEKLFPGVFDELENPDHCWGNEGLRSLSVEFRTLRKGLGLIGKKKKLFHEWLKQFLDKHWDYWDLHGGTTKCYAECENFEYNGRRWILISRRGIDGARWKIDPNENSVKVTYE
jgi:hypothetical protein